MLVIISSGEAVRVVAWSQHFSRPGRAGFCQPGSRYASQGLWRGLVEVHGKAACPVPRSLAPKDYAESVRDLPRAPKQNSHKSGLLPSAEVGPGARSEEHTSELQSRQYLVCRLLLEKKKKMLKVTT